MVGGAEYVLDDVEMKREVSHKRFRYILDHELLIYSAHNRVKCNYIILAAHHCFNIHLNFILGIEFRDIFQKLLKQCC